jgi:hypothetical protein
MLSLFGAGARRDVVFFVGLTIAGYFRPAEREYGIRQAVRRELLVT